MAALERLPALVRFEADMHRRIDIAFNVAVRDLLTHTPMEQAALWDAREAAYLLPCRCARQIALEEIR